MNWFPENKQCFYVPLLAISVITPSHHLRYHMIDVRGAQINKCILPLGGRSTEGLMKTLSTIHVIHFEMLIRVVNGRSHFLKLHCQRFHLTSEIIDRLILLTSSSVKGIDLNRTLRKCMRQFFHLCTIYFPLEFPSTPQSCSLLVPVSFSRTPWLDHSSEGRSKQQRKRENEALTYDNLQNYFEGNQLWHGSPILCPLQTIQMNSPRQWERQGRVEKTVQAENRRTTMTWESHQIIARTQKPQTWSLTKWLTEYLSNSIHRGNRPYR